MRRHNGLRYVANVCSFLENRENVLLLVIAFFAPHFVGFQYLEWLYNAGTHLTFMVYSLTWAWTFSDWYYGVEGNLFGWLLSPNFVLFAMFLLPFMLFSSSFYLPSMFDVLVPLLDLVFIAMVVLYKQGRIDRIVLMLSGIAVLANSIIVALVLITNNTIYGIPPGVLISILAPDRDIRFFVPIPLLLIVGWYQTRNVSKTVQK